MNGSKIATLAAALLIGLGSFNVDARPGGGGGGGGHGGGGGGHGGGGGGPAYRTAEAAVGGGRSMGGAGRYGGGGPSMGPGRSMSRSFDRGPGIRGPVARNFDRGRCRPETSIVARTAAAQG